MITGVCSRCGKRIISGAHYCVRCGMAVTPAIPRMPFEVRRPQVPNRRAGRGIWIMGCVFVAFCMVHWNRHPYSLQIPSWPIHSTPPAPVYSPPPAPNLPPIHWDRPGHHGDGQ